MTIVHVTFMRLTFILKFNATLHARSRPMRTSFFIKSNLLTALLVFVCAACIQAQTGASGRSGIDADQTSQTRNSKYRFVPSTREAIANPQLATQPIETAVEVEEIERPQFEDVTYSGPLDSGATATIPSPDASTQPFPPASFETQPSPQKLANAIPLVAELPTPQIQYPAPPQQASAQEPIMHDPTNQVFFSNASTAIAPQSMAYLPQPRKAYYLPINEADVCDEWDGFSACGGLKAYPGHWGIRCLTGCDPCEAKPCDCHACRSKHGCKGKKGKCADCDPCNQDGCDRCRRRKGVTATAKHSETGSAPNDCGCAACAKSSSPGLLDLFR